MRLRTSVYGLIEYWRVGGTGRRRGLKNPREQSHIGSIPIPATIWYVPPKNQCKRLARATSRGRRWFWEKSRNLHIFFHSFHRLASIYLIIR
jgi:hypothetical protein